MDLTVAACLPKCKYLGSGDGAVGGILGVTEFWACHKGSLGLRPKIFWGENRFGEAGGVERAGSQRVTITWLSAAKDKPGSIITGLSMG